MVSVKIFQNFVDFVCVVKMNGDIGLKKYICR